MKYKVDGKTGRGPNEVGMVGEMMRVGMWYECEAEAHRREEDGGDEKTRRLDVSFRGRRSPLTSATRNVKIC